MKRGTGKLISRIDVSEFGHSVERYENCGHKVYAMYGHEDHIVTTYDDLCLECWKNAGMPKPGESYES